MEDCLKDIPLRFYIRVCVFKFYFWIKTESFIYNSYCFNTFLKVSTYFLTSDLLRDFKKLLYKIQDCIYRRDILFSDFCIKNTVSIFFFK